MYVYILKTKHHNKYYTGLTTNPKERLEEHNNGKNISTREHRPWEFKNLFWFRDEVKAKEFERYLKSGSGRAFAIKYF